jgi:wyosine [tRNA(Phe)-imidazoG37] synthetase (radical SAM superfamily)
MDCLYCQLGKTSLFCNERREFVPTEEIIREIECLPPMKIDHFTFSGRGEPTLAKNLGDMIRALRKIRQEKIAVITNSTLLNREDVERDLLLCDTVVAKLDAFDQVLLIAINKVMHGIHFKDIFKGLKTFRKNFKGKLALQIMFIRENQDYASQIAELTREINPDEVELDTPLRPCGVEPLTPGELDELKTFFKGLPVISVYDRERQFIPPLDMKETKRRHGQYNKIVTE